MAVLQLEREIGFASKPQALENSGVDLRETGPQPRVCAGLAAHRLVLGLLSILPLLLCGLMVSRLARYGVATALPAVNGSLNELGPAATGVAALALLALSCRSSLSSIFASAGLWGAIATFLWTW